MKKIAFVFDPFDETGIEIPSDKREDALADVAAYVLEQTLSAVGGSRTPVDGGSWSPLSKEYAKKKKLEVGNARANLEEHGDMLDALECLPTGGRKLSLQIAGEEAPKADGHNNFSGKSKLPERNFIPDKKRGQTFSDNIWSGIKSILETYVEETPANGSEASNQD